MKAGIAIDNWKLPIFERHLKQSGYTFTSMPFVEETQVLHVQTDNLEERCEWGSPYLLTSCAPRVAELYPRRSGNRWAYADAGSRNHSHAGTCRARHCEGLRMEVTTETNDRAGPVAGLVTLAEHQRQRERFFPSEESLRWHVRQHRQALAAAGAVLFISGRLWIDAARFDAFMLAAGQEAAKRRAGG